MIGAEVITRFAAGRNGQPDNGSEHSRTDGDGSGNQSAASEALRTGAGNSQSKADREPSEPAAIRRGRWYEAVAGPALEHEKNGEWHTVGHVEVRGKRRPQYVVICVGVTIWSAWTMDEAKAALLEAGGGYGGGRVTVYNEWSRAEYIRAHLPDEFKATAEKGSAELSVEFRQVFADGVKLREVGK